MSVNAMTEIEDSSDTLDSQVKYIPPELVELIMRYLDGRTLIACRRVCKTWCQITDRLMQEDDHWKNLCLLDYPEAWASVYESGQMTWLEVYINIALWANINTAWITSRTFKTNSNADKRILTLNVSKVGTLNITFRYFVKLIDLGTLRLLKALPGQYFCYFENEFVRMVHQENHTLRLECTKKSNTEDAHSSVSIDSVYLFKVARDICYYITLKQELYMQNLRDNRKQSVLLVKWYNSDRIVALDCHKNKVFLLTNSGKILTYESNRLVKIRDVKWPNDSNLYQKLYLYRGNIFFYCDYKMFYISIPNGKEQIYSDLFVSCILLHGNILIIGTYFGVLRLYLINNLEDLLMLNQITPISKHVLCVDTPISGIDIFEESKSHSVFAWTESKIYMIKYKHVSQNSADMLCNNLAVCSIFQCNSEDINLNSSSDESDF